MDGICGLLLWYYGLFGGLHGGDHVVETAVIMGLCVDDGLCGWWLVGCGGWCVEVVVCWWSCLCGWFALDGEVVDDVWCEFVFEDE